MYSVLITEYTYLCISKSITSSTLLLVFRIAESHQCIFKVEIQVAWAGMVCNCTCTSPDMPYLVYKACDYCLISVTGLLGM